MLLTALVQPLHAEPDAPHTEVFTGFEASNYASGYVGGGYAFGKGLCAPGWRVPPHDPNNTVQGTKIGLRLLAETWYDISSRWFLSADASYGTAFREYFSLARVGFRVRPKLSFGIEGGALGNQEYEAGRGGGFVRVNLRKLEITASGGFTGDYLMEDPSGYVSLGLYRTF